MSKQILVVEDDDVLNQLIPRCLRGAGYEVTGARRWAEADRYLEKREPHLVITDVRLPDGDKLRRGGEHFFRVAWHFDFAPFPAQHALGVDQESAALDTHVLPAVHALFLPHVEELAHGLVCVSQQREREAVPGDELVVRSDAVGRDADDLRAGLPELRVQVAEGFAFPGATRRVVLRIEVHNEVPAGGIGQPPFCATAGDSGKGGHLAVERDGLCRHE